MRKGVGYVRVSRVGARDGDTFISPRVQRDRITETARANSVELVEWFEDMDESGGKWQRPGFQQALERVERGVASVIVVARLTRFARSVLDTERALARLDAAGGALIAGDINIDTTTPTGRLVRGLMSVVAEFELEVARENWSVAKTSAVNRGVKIANRAPYGYRFDNDHRLEPDPATAHLIPRVFEMRAAGESRQTIVRMWAEQTGVWMAPQTVGDIVRNTAYLGEVTYGDLRKEGAHPALVTRGLFDAAQRFAEARARKRPPSLLAGILVCGACGRPMTAAVGAMKADGQPRLMYRCQKTSRDGPCPTPVSVIRGRADTHVEQLFLQWADVEAKGTSVEERETRAAAETLERARAELAAYLRADLASVVGVSAFRDGAVVREQHVADAQASLDRVSRGRDVATMVARVRERWPGLPVLERRALIASVVDRVVVHRSSGRPVPFAERSLVVWRD